MSDNKSFDDMSLSTSQSSTLKQISDSQQTSINTLRPPNPLSKLSSYNYQLSLYMITPDSYNEYLANNRTGISLRDSSGKGAYLILQSGGIEPTQRTTSFNLDYYIDNLKIKTAISPAASSTSSAVTEMSFEITEPYGFSFLSNLKKAADQISTYTRTKGMSHASNPTRQFFILGIRFFGYDDSGDLVGSSTGLYERFYDILITKISTQITGKNTVYNINAAGTSMQTVMGLKRGTIKKGAEVTGFTLNDVLNGNDPVTGKIGLCAKLNRDEIESNKDSPFNNTYSVEFIGEDQERLRNAKVVIPSDLDKSRLRMARLKSVEGVNLRVAEKEVVDVNSKSIIFKNDTPILQAIQQLITQSTYISDALEEVYTTQDSPDKNTKSPAEIKPDTNKILRWFNVTPTVGNFKWDKNRADYTVDIVYQIQSYKTPVIFDTIANKTDLYYGPAKRYSYWYTGKNQEILKYSQQLDAAYYNVVLVQDGTPSGTGAGAEVPKVAGARNSGLSLGLNNQGAEAFKQYSTQLLDPKGFAQAKIEILGDPDWLIQPATIQQLRDSARSGINVNLGQVMIEIDFKEAVDYETDSGLMSINDSILLWNYPKEIVKKYGIEGISYLVIAVTNYFRAGKFTQELECRINTFDYYENLEKDRDRERNKDQTFNAAEDIKFLRQGSQPGSATSSSGSTTSSSTGLVKNPNLSMTPSETLVTAVQINPAAPTQGADDDANPRFGPR